MNDFNLIEYQYRQMMSLGLPRHSLLMTIDKQLVDKLSIISKTPLKTEDLENLADICIANEWLERTTFDQYRNLRLTENGLKLAQAELEPISSSTFTFKNWVEGNPVLVGSFVAVITTVISVIWT